MPNTREIKRRIKSVGNIRQITRAMQLVATSKRRRSEKRSRDADAYAYGALEILENLTRAMKGEPEHPYWKENGRKKDCFILVATDRGFCGGLNVSLGASALSFIKKLREEGAEVEAVSVGKKGRVFLKRAGVKIVADFPGLGDYFTVRDSGSVARVATEDYAKGEYRRIFIGFTQFVNTLIQKPVIRQILPLTVESFAEIAELRRNGAIPASGQAVYLFEPSAEKVFAELVPHLVRVVIYKALLESQASEHAARMVAMKNATDKAGELIGDLTLAFNQARQAAITAEIAEISSGAAASL